MTTSSAKLSLHTLSLLQHRPLANHLFSFTVWTSGPTPWAETGVSTSTTTPTAINVPSACFIEINIDIVDPLPESRDGHRYVLTFIDRLSRWPKVAPLKSITAKDVALKIVETWISCAVRSFCNKNNNSDYFFLNKTVIDTNSHYINNNQHDEHH